MEIKTHFPFYKHSPSKNIYGSPFFLMQNKINKKVSKENHEIEDK